MGLPSADFLELSVRKMKEEFPDLFERETMLVNADALVDFIFDALDDQGFLSDLPANGEGELAEEERLDRLQRSKDMKITVEGQ